MVIVSLLTLASMLAWHAVTLVQESLPVYYKAIQAQYVVEGVFNYGLARCVQPDRQLAQFLDEPPPYTRDSIILYTGPAHTHKKILGTVTLTRNGSSFSLRAQASSTLPVQLPVITAQVRIQPGIPRRRVSVTHYSCSQRPR